MDNLADRVIQANKDGRRAAAEDEFNRPEFDDIGFPLPKVDTEHAKCEYLTARILYLNDRIYKHQGLLWLRGDVIKENKNTYYRLAKYPKMISDPECQYVWRRLKEIVPKLDTDTIAVLPNLTFNMKTGEFREERVRTTTPWEETYE